MLEKETTDYIDLLIEEPYKLGEWLGFGTFSAIHNDWLKKFILNEEDYTLQAHRGSYKTTCLIIAISILMVLFPNKNIIFLRKTDDDVKEVITAVKKILERDVMKFIINKIYKGFDFKVLTSNTTEITTNLMTASKGSAQLLGIGIKGSLTGKHADIVITDDIVNLKDRVSRAERDFTKSVYMELQNIKNRGGRIINAGTPWHKDDCFGLMGKIDKYDCYTTGLITKEQIKELRNTMTASLFSANYELKHIASEDVMFENPQFANDIRLIENGISHIDARYSGKDHSAYTILKERDNKLYVFGKMWDKHIDECLDEIEQYQKKYKVGKIYCETNADKGYLARELRDRDNLINTYHEDMNKYVKIVTFLKKEWERVVFIDDTDPNYLNEILDFTDEAEFDDAPDSLASLIRLKPKIRVEEKEEPQFFNFEIEKPLQKDYGERIQVV